jgi:NAD(P) transhydrogenase subunit alpha
MDIVITTALIPGRPAPKLWTKDMVEMMKPGSVIVDLAAERGGNCDLTVGREDRVRQRRDHHRLHRFPQPHGRAILHALRHQHPSHDDRPDAREGRQVVHNMEDDVIRGATVTFEGEITFPPPPPKVAAIAAAPKKEKAKELTPEEKRRRDRGVQGADEEPGHAARHRRRAGAGVGLIAPASFMQHFIVFVLSVFIGFQVIWNVAHSLHTPLMAVTNAISSIIILGALMQIGSASVLITVLAALGIFMAAMNIFGGFLVTRRMLAMFQKS